VDVPVLITGSPGLLVTSDICPPAGSPSSAVVARSPDPGEPFRVLAQVGADYNALSAAVKAAAEEYFGHHGWLGLKFSVSDAEVRDAQGQILVALTLTGSLNGTVYFWGTPVLSPDGKIVSVSDADLAAESKLALIGIDAQLPTIITDLFRQPIRDHLRLDVEQLAAPIKTIAGKGVTFPGGSIMIGQFDLKPLDVRSIPSSLQVDVLLTGTATGVIDNIPAF
jgi:hypothetical protein